ncbi:MAG TPA: hypothetical protein VFD57_04800 [Clostridia bacterium]|nr:hypothetical protein [Clostridia bacterium]
MSKYILFSPIGATDPIRQEHDGPLLHILRHYKPHKVYLYFTKEMVKKREEVLSALKSFDVEVEEIIRDIDNPHDFDIFAAEFDRLLINIQKENEDSRILLNVTSGTTQMISALCLEVVTSRVWLKPIQVSTPSRGSNENILFGGDVQNNLDDLMEDGVYMMPNRCMEPDILSFRRSSLKRDIMSLIEHYEYRAATEKIEDNLHLFDKNLLELLEYAHLRQNDNKDHKKSPWHEEFNYTKDVMAGKACNYYCILSNKSKTGELSYFIVLTKSVAEYIAKSCVGIFRHSDVAGALNKYYMERNGQSYISQKYRGEIIYNLEQYTVIMEYQGKPKEIISKFGELLECTKTRNTLAHDLKIEEDVNANKVLSLLKALMVEVYGNKIKKGSFELYENINQKVIELL